MFNNIKKIINNKKAQKLIKVRQENRRKYFEIRGAVIKFYEDQDASTGQIEIPAFQRADTISYEIRKLQGS